MNKSNQHSLPQSLEVAIALWEQHLNEFAVLLSDAIPSLKMMVLEKIHKENDIKNLSPEELTMLADEIRQFLIEKISVTGGHLASNLGVVELTMALHLVFDLPQDKLIWDVGHQAYTHKLLTGRKAGFDELRKYGGMSGFPKRKESECDAFDTGHSSTSISAGLGYVAARELQGGTHSVVSKKARASACAFLCFSHRVLGRKWLT